MNVNEMIQKAVEKRNESNRIETENTVNHLVECILAAEGYIVEQQQLVVDYKERLKQLQMPEPVALSLEA